MNKRNFKDIELKLCHFCGTCKGVCPTGAVEYDIEKSIIHYDRKKCVDCGRCFDHCPGINVNFDRLDDYFKEKKQREEFIGYYHDCYLGCSTDSTIRKNGSSGGMVTQLLIYLIENKIVDGVIIPRPCKTAKWLFRPKIVTDVEEIKDSSQSKYCLIPSNEILAKLKYQNGQYAIVLLPCQIHAIRKLQNEGDKDAMKLKYIFGLFCGYNMEYNATKYGMYRTRTKKEEIIDIQYREHGSWPGGMSFKRIGGEKRGINFFHYHYLNAVYLPYRCRMCPDFFAEYADISFGDSWLTRLLGHGIDERGLPLGWSSIISRTETSVQLLNQAMRDEVIYLEKVPNNDIKESFPFNIKYKKDGIFVRLKFNNPIPIYKGWGLDSFKKPENFYYHYIYNLVLSIGSTKIFRAALYIFPMNVLLFLIKEFKKIMRYPPNARDLVLQYKENSNVFEEEKK